MALAFTPIMQMVVLFSFIPFLWVFLCSKPDPKFSPDHPMSSPQPHIKYAIFGVSIYVFKPTGWSGGWGRGGGGGGGEVIPTLNYRSS